MTQSQKDKQEWLDVADQIIANYHKRQYKLPNRSTVMFCDWLEEIDLMGAQRPAAVLDLGAGMGANVHYMAQRYPQSRFQGVELNPKLAAAGRDALLGAGIGNGTVTAGDIYDLDSDYDAAFDGIVSYMLLSWLPGYEAPLERMAALRPGWIAMTSLFYDGPVNTIIRTQDYTLPLNGCAYRESYYNIYAIPLVRESLAGLGYVRFFYRRFDIDIDLPQPDDRGMGSYTQQLADGHRLQFGGPVHLSWYFVAAARAGGKE